MPWEFWGQEERTKWDISGWSLCLGTIIRTSCEALSLIPMSRAVALLHISQRSLTWSTGECFWHLYRLGRLLWGPAKSCWIPALHLGESYPKARCLKGNIGCLSFRYFLLKFLFHWIIFKLLQSLCLLLKFLCLQHHIGSVKGCCWC